MIPELRKAYNHSFTNEKYQAFINELSSLYPGQLDFRVAETPVFVPESFKQKILSACEHIIHVISSPGYIENSNKAIPSHLQVPGQDDMPHCIAFDFGVCKNASGELEPQLIEMQGFPSLFAWQAILPEVQAKHFNWPEEFDVYMDGFNRSSYVELLRKMIIENEEKENVVLLEIFPEKQKTRVDFHATETLLGIKTVCLTELIQEEKKLFYLNEGKKTRIKRIYNRIIFDDLFQQSLEVQEKGKIFQQELDVAWVPHPNWFYRISKFSLPFIQHPFVPETDFLDKNNLPADLENYVVKPLFSFAGQGVIIDVTKEAIDAITDPGNWIIQKKVTYAEAIETPGEPAKVEMRIFYLKDPSTNKLRPANNLARLSKGKMIGVRYNKDKDWVGGSFCLFEKKP